MIPPEVKITKATTNKSKDYAAFSSEGDLQEIRVLGSRLHQVTAPAPPICLRQRVWPPRIHMRMVYHRLSHKHNHNQFHRTDRG